MLGRGRPWRTAVVGLGAVVALGVLAPGTSVAAPEPLPANLTGLTADSTSVTGNVTIRSGDPRVRIDPATVKATIGSAAEPVVVSPAAQETRRSVLVIDRSGSMGASGMSTVRSAVAAFLKAAPKDVAVGVVSFGDSARTDLAPTLDRTAVQHAVDGLTAGGQTALFAGVGRAVNLLGNADDKSLVLLSDGGETIVSPAKQPAALRALVDTVAKNNVRAEIIRFKTKETADATLQAIAAAGGGSVAAATNDAAVTQAFTAAAAVLDTQARFTIRPAHTYAGSQEITLSGLAGGRPFVATATMDVGSLTGTATPTPSSSSTSSAVAVPSVPADPKVWGVSTTLSVAVLALFIGLFILILGLVSPALKSRRQRRVEAIQQYAAAGQELTRTALAKAQPSAVGQQLVDMGDRIMAGRDSTTRTMELVERADLPWRAGEWFVIRVLSVIFGAAVVWLLLESRLGFFAALLGALIGLLLPAVLLRFFAQRRANRFEDILPDVLMLVATSLSSGFSLPQALDAVARDAAQPAAKEFSRSLAEQRIGADMSDSLERMAVRMDSENLRWTTMAIRIQREVGGNLAETLRTTAKTLRDRDSLRRQVRALSAEGRLSAYILIAMPILIFLYSMWANYDYVSLLWTTTLGIIMLIVGVVAMVIGVFWMRKVVQIEV